MQIDSKIFKVVVKPGSKSNEIAGYDEPRKAYRVNIAAPAEQNKANKELVKFLSKEQGKKVRIKTGLTCQKSPCAR